MDSGEIVERGTILRATVGSTVHGLHHGGQDDREEKASGGSCEKGELHERSSLAEVLLDSATVVAMKRTPAGYHGPPLPVD